MIAFTILTLLFIPVIITYQNGNGIQTKNWMVKASLGNLGQAHAQCVH